MPRYYFHVRRGQTTILDHQGIELADTVDVDVEAAKRAQQSVNGESLNGESMNARSVSQGRIIVTDDWETLFEFPF
jgi:predicted homoserine dehydrogenase-like protein